MNKGWDRSCWPGNTSQDMARALAVREAVALGAACILRRHRCQMRTGPEPQVMAALRKLVIGLTRRTQAPKVAAAPRHYDWKPSQGLTLLDLPALQQLKDPAPKVITAIYASGPQALTRTPSLLLPPVCY